MQPPDMAATCRRMCAAQGSRQRTFQCRKHPLSQMRDPRNRCDMLSYLAGASTAKATAAGLQSSTHSLCQPVTSVELSVGSFSLARCCRHRCCMWRRQRGAAAPAAGCPNLPARSYSVCSLMVSPLQSRLHSTLNFAASSPAQVLQAAAEAGRYCHRCGLPKPAGAHHCHICDRCILSMDHHCPWWVFPLHIISKPFVWLFLTLASPPQGVNVQKDEVS